MPPRPHNRSRSMTWLSVAVALAGACSTEPASSQGGGPQQAPTSQSALTLDLNLKVASQIRTCESIEPPQRDWCILTGLQTAAMQGARGEWIYQVCERLEDPSPTDLCIELASRLGNGPGMEGCEKIGNAVLRDSCLLATADEVVVNANSAQEVASTCAPLGQHTEHCIVHFAESWLPRWQRAGWNTMNQDLDVVMGQITLARTSNRFATTVGQTTMRLGWGNSPQHPCDKFEKGSEYHQHCMRAARGWAQQR